jgi:hypothetical protein
LLSSGGSGRNKEETHPREFELQKKMKKLEAERLRTKKRRYNLRITLELMKNLEVAEKLK